MSTLNAGILGHVDAGKTTLTRALADVASTAAFDKHAERQGRHNTIDLGFSCVYISSRRIALIDCPGHASLIRAVLSTCAVFDMAIVLIDASAGIQQQTAEHLLLASFFCPDKVLILINKIDLVGKKELDELTRRIRKNLTTLGICSESPIIAISLTDPDKDLSAIREAIAEMLFEPKRNIDAPFLMTIDHSFSVTGQGSVITGTVINGIIKQNDEIAMTSHPDEKRRVRSVESWKEAVDEVRAGERAALLVTGAGKIHARSLVTHYRNSSLLIFSHCLASFHAISFYRSPLKSGMKVHISAYCETVISTCQFLVETGENEFERLAEPTANCTAVLFSFDRPLCVPPDMFYIASKLEQQGKGCRFAFRGQLNRLIKNPENEINQFVRKSKEGKIERVEEGRRSAIATGIFKKESNINVFEGMHVILQPSGQVGKIEAKFGKSGKTRISFDRPIDKEICDKIEDKRGEIVRVKLFMKKYTNTGKIVSYIP